MEKNNVSSTNFTSLFYTNIQTDFSYWFLSLIKFETTMAQILNLFMLENLIPVLQKENIFVNDL